MLVCFEWSQKLGAVQCCQDSRVKRFSCTCRLSQQSVHCDPFQLYHHPVSASFAVSAGLNTSCFFTAPSWDWSSQARLWCLTHPPEPQQQAEQFTCNVSWTTMHRSSQSQPDKDTPSQEKGGKHGIIALLTIFC